MKKPISAKEIIENNHRYANKLDKYRSHLYTTNFIENEIRRISSSINVIKAKLKDGLVHFDGEINDVKVLMTAFMFLSPLDFPKEKREELLELIYSVVFSVEIY